MFSRDDARWVSEAAAALYSAQTLDALTAGAMAAVRQRFRLVASTCEECSYDMTRYVMHALETTAVIPRDYAAHIHDNPAGPFVASGRLRTVSQLRRITSMGDWQKTDHFNGIARPVGYSDQLLTLATDAHRFYALGIYRDAVFSDKEYELMSLLQPHLHAAWRRVQPPPDGLPGPASSRLLLSRRLAPFHLTARQRQLLHAYFPGWRSTTTPLPEMLRRWVSNSLRLLDHTPLPRPLQALSAESAHGRLLVRCFPPGENGPVTLFMVEMPHTPDFLRLRAHGLTSRECEVLHWLAQGKRNAEIATILATAPRTIGKHVEHIMAKLGVENRAAAVSLAHARLDAGK